jgi:protein TonB
LGLENDADEYAIKRAYARKLKQIDQEKDPAGFQALRETYEAALSWARQHATDQDAGEKYSESEPEPPREQAAASVDAIELAPAAEAALRQTWQEESPDVDARTVFSQLAGSLIEAPRDLEQVRALFNGAIDDPRLIRVETRDLFEWYIAQLLAQGWRPGHECLFEVAIKHFNWQDDRRRLYRFGQVGEILDHAIHERSAFGRQEQHSKQLDLIRALRLSVRPSNGKLADGLPALEEIAKRFPTLFPLITSEENLERWRLWTKEVGAWRRNLGQSRARSLLKTNHPGAKKGSWGKSVFTILVVMSALSGLANLLKSNPSSYSNAPHPASMAQPDSSRLAAPSTSNLAPNTDTDWLFRGPLASEKLAALLVKEPTAETCAEVAAIAEVNPAGLTQQDRGLALRFDNRIITCVSMRLWPGGTNDFVVRAASERLMPRLKSVR